MENIKIIIQGSRTGDAEYSIKMDEGELLALKLALSVKEKLNLNEEPEKDETKCHLCGSIEEAGGWCTNKSCAEYIRDEAKQPKKK